MPHFNSTNMPSDTGGASISGQSGEVILSVSGLSKRFTLHERGASYDGFVNIALEARAGQFTGLVGASGSGKSSILRCIYRTYLSTSGSICFHTSADETVDLASADEQTILTLRRREIRFVSQFLHSLPRQTATDVAAAPLIENGMDPDQAHVEAERTLAQIGVPRRLWNLPPATFSGGERQLVNMSRALIVRPRLLLLDEPTASLDPESTRRTIEAIERLKEERVAMVGVFHDRRLMDRLSDTKLELSGGMTWETEANAFAEALR